MEVCIVNLFRFLLSGHFLPLPLPPPLLLPPPLPPLPLPSPSPPRLHRNGIPCPEVVSLRKHVLIMSFIGKDQVPAPKLKNAQLKPDQWNSAYHQCVQVRTLYMLYY